MPCHVPRCTQLHNKYKNMIIDLILDRQNGIPYDAREFYNSVSQYGEIGQEIATALDSGTERDVKKAIVMYLLENGYNADICTYAMSVDWL